MTLHDADSASVEKNGTVSVRDARDAQDDAAEKAGVRNTVLSWYQHFLQKPALASADGRHIPLRLAGKPLVDERRGRPYVSNAIRTSRYTVYDFLPKQLFFQFSRLANFYFLCVGVPQTIPGLSTTGNYTTILPLLFFVLLTVAKEGFDDWKRHRLDGVENARQAVALRPGDGAGEETKREWWKPVSRFLPFSSPPATPAPLETEPSSTGFQWTRVAWQDLRVGDVVRLARDEDVPADMVLLHADGEGGLAFVETAALDGETNLKSKRVSAALDGCSSIDGIACNQNIELVVEDPHPDLYRFDGRVSRDHETPLPLTVNEVVYRGCTLRNTPRALGVVVNTGEDCKIRRNANRHPSAKKPALERVSNRIVVSLAAYVVLLSAGCSAGYVWWRGTTEQHAWYLEGATVRLEEIVIGFAIQFNNVIPLALYISLEIVKMGQMLFVNSDVDMYDAASDTPARCNTNTILENLGQIGYVFSDKTGTLTDNVMKFRKMSIGGVAWVHGTDHEKGEEEEGDDPTTRDLLEYVRLRPHSPLSKQAVEYILALAVCHTCLPETMDDGRLEYQAASPDELALVQAARELGVVLVQRSARSLTLRTAEQDAVYEVLDVIEFSSKRKRMSVAVRCPDGRIWFVTKGADSTVLPRLQTAGLALQKAAEVRCSADLQRQLLRKSEAREPSLSLRRSATLRRSLTMRRRRSMGAEHKSKSFEAGRLRKSEDLLRRSLAVRTASLDGRRPGSVPVTTSLPPKLALLESLDEPQVFSQCFRHLDEFAAEGLRTLVFAHKYVPEPEYRAWKLAFDAATTSLVDRDARIDEAAELMEHSLDLAGASAIEDKLQAGVPETIDRLRRANMRIWMLTGDKRETAVNIAHSARVCRPESEIFTLDAARGDLGPQLLAVVDDLELDPASPVKKPGHSVVVVDGHTLAAIDEPASPLPSLFYHVLIPNVDSVICCRASPAQKALLVRSIRRASAHPLASSFLSRLRAWLRFGSAPTSAPLTLAIGDGANDLAMLAEAHVGVGVSGREGLQAARVADYSIARFRFLGKLLLVHGRWSYARTARFVLATFWKEVFFYLPAALYQRYNGYTGTSLYENWSLTVLNTLFTSLCVVVPAVWDQDLAAETLMAVPELYVYGQRGLGLGAARYAAWMAAAAVEGVLVWLACWAALGGAGGVLSSSTPVRDEGLFALGDLAFSTGIMWTNIKLLLLDTHYKTVVVLGSAAITLGGWWAWNGFLSAIYAPDTTPYAVRGGFSTTFGRDPAWWLTLVGVLAVLVAGELGYRALKRSVGGGFRRRSPNHDKGSWWRWSAWKRGGGGSGAALGDIGTNTSTDDDIGEAGSVSAEAEFLGNVEEWRVELWQEIERDAAMREVLRKMSRGDVDSETSFLA